MQRVRRLEDPLNHLLGLFFALAPRAFISQVILHATGESCEGPFRSLGKSGWDELGLGANTQPDISLHAADALTNIEVKVLNGHSDIERVVKYGLIAMRARQRYGVSACQLIYLTPYDLPRIFRPSVADWSAVRSAAIELAPNVKKEAFTVLSDDERAALLVAIAELRLSSLTFTEFDGLLGGYIDAAPRPEVEARLISGLREELRSRKLVGD